MQRTLSAAAALGGALAGRAVRGVRGSRRPSAGDLAMRRLTAYFIVPVWVTAGFLDALYHRRTKIETTSGLEESLLHSVMMAEAAPPVLAALFLEITPTALAAMMAFSALHEATVLWDLWYTESRRTIHAGEQVVHTFLESPPLLATAAAIATHWEEFRVLLDRRGQVDWTDLRFRQPPLPRRTIAAIFTALLLFGAIPHADELRRCIRAKEEGLAGADTPACLAEASA